MSHKQFIVIGLFGVLAFLPYLRSKKYMTDCVFCDIAEGENPTTKIEYESDEYVIFQDIRPASKYHYLAVPKGHIESVMNLTKKNEKLGKNTYTLFSTRDG